MIHDIYNMMIMALGLFAVSAFISLVSGNKPARTGWIHFVLSGSASALLGLVCWTVLTGGAPEAAVFAFGPLSLVLLIDGLSAIFLAVIAFAAVIASFYSVKYMEHYKGYSVRMYYFMLPLFIAGMAALVTVDDLSIGFTLAWQLMTITSFFLIRFEHRKDENRRFALRYLVIMQMAWAAVAGGAFWASGTFTGETIHHISGQIGRGGLQQYAVYGLILAGFACKAAVFPLGQMWLPGAHSVAPAPVSALLSGVMLKTGIYGIIRTVFWMNGSAFDAFFWGWVLALAGTVTLFIGTVQSMKQNDGKRLLAYSSIGQLGYIVFALGTALIFHESGSAAGYMITGAALCAALFHMMNHAVFKGLLFLTSGSVLYSTGEKELNRLGGLMALMPFTSAAAAVASLSIAGMPPFSGFASKWSIIVPPLGSALAFPLLAVCAIIALFTSVITLACYVKYFGMTFTSTGLEKRTDIREIPFTMKLPVAALAIVCLVQGLFPGLSVWFITAALGKSAVSGIAGQGFFSAGLWGLSSVSGAASPLVVAAVLAVLLVFAVLLRGRISSGRRSVEPWLCGYQLTHADNRYRSQSMFSPLKNFFRWAGGNDDRL